MSRKNGPVIDIDEDDVDDIGVADIPQIEAPQLPVTADVQEKMSPQMALELAAGLRPPAAVLQKYGVSRSEWEVFKKHPHFLKLYKEAKDYWNSDANATERVKAVSTMMVEESLLTLFGMVHDTDSTPTNRMEAFRTLAKMSGTDQHARKGDETAEMGSRFSVTINLGGKQEKVVVDSVPADDGFYDMTDPNVLEGNDGS